MRTKLFFILPLLLSADIALADSFTATGSLNLTIGTTGVNGTAGLLYGDGALLQSIGATVTNTTNGSPLTSVAFASNVQLALTTNGVTGSPYSSMLSFNNTASDGGWSTNAIEIYSNLGGIHSLNTYINNIGIYFSRLNLVVSGHFSPGTGAGGNWGPGYAINPSNNYLPGMIGAWADVTGPAFIARTNVGTSGELAFAGQSYSGVFTIGLDSNNSQFILGATTISAPGQVFTGDTFLARAAAANFRFGGADAASPIAQTISFQNVLAGTSNTAGVDTYFLASAGTGTGAGGKFHFQTAAAGSSGSTKNTFADMLVIDGSTGVTVGGSINAGAYQISANDFIVGTNISWTNGTTIHSTGNGAFGFYNNGGSQSFGLSNLGTGGVALGTVTGGDYSGTLKLTTLITAPLTYATLPASPSAGQRAYITDGNTTTYYATVSSGGGSSNVSVLYNGSNWVVD